MMNDVFLILICLLLATPYAVSASDPMNILFPPPLRTAEQMPAESRELLSWFLCSSKDWSVSDSGGALVAEYRHPARLAPDGKCDTDSFRCELSVRFSPYKYGSPVWLREGRFTFAKAADREVRLSPVADAPSQQNAAAFSTRLVLSLAHDLLVEVYERSSVKERGATTNALALVASLLSSVSHGRPTLNDKLTAEGARVVFGDASALSCAQQLRMNKVAPGQYQVSGYLNPMKRGFIEVAIQDPQTGRTINQAKLHRTVQWTGWSSDPSELFYFQMPVSADGSGAAQDVQLLVRFMPQEATVLISTNCTIETWSR